MKKAAGTIVFYKGSILLAKRQLTYKGKPVDFGGYWSIFTGGSDEGEDSIDTACRELDEETRIKVSPCSLDYVDTVYNKSCELCIFAYESPKLVAPILDFEHTEYGWFRLSSLSGFPDLIDNKVLSVILSYSKKRKR